MRFVKRHIKVRPKEQRTVDGIVFDSGREAQRYGELKMLQIAGVVKNLKCHTRWPIVILPLDKEAAPVTVGRGWTDDFQYDEFRDGAWRHVVEDVKPVDTRESKFRRAIVEALHGIKIKVVE